jgi:hypothetical protein
VLAPASTWRGLGLQWWRLSVIPLEYVVCIPSATLAPDLDTSVLGTRVHSDVSSLGGYAPVSCTTSSAQLDCWCDDYRVYWLVSVFTGLGACRFFKTSGDVHLQTGAATFLRLRLEWVASVSQRGCPLDFVF